MKNKKIAIAGHAGIGHVHGVSGFVQDDTAGFISVAYILKEWLNVDTRVLKTDVNIDKNLIKISTIDGGEFCSGLRRGITPSEALLMNKIVGKDAIYCQALALRVFGRIYGQGVFEVPVVLQGVLANSVMDTFYKKEPKKFKILKESIPSNCGFIGGLEGRIYKNNVVLMLSVNFTEGGLGPAEDLEGNIPLGSKYTVMKELGVLKCPTIVIESKAFVPFISKELTKNTILVRAQKNIDNPAVAEALYESAVELGYPVIFRDDLIPRTKGYLKKQTAGISEKIIKTAKNLINADYSYEKAKIVSELAEIISEDAGAVTCLSNYVHEVFGSPGLIPGTSAVLSMLVTKKYIDHWKIPVFNRDDAETVKSILIKAVEKISKNYNAAMDYLNQNYTDFKHMEKFETDEKNRP